MDIDVVQLASEVFQKISRYLPHEKASGIFNDISEIFGMAQAQIAEAQIKYASATKKIRQEAKIRESKEDLYKHKLDEAKQALRALRAENARIVREQERELAEKAQALERHWRKLLVAAEQRLAQKKEADFKEQLQSQEVLWRAETQKELAKIQEELRDHYEKQLEEQTENAGSELAEMSELLASMQKRVEDLEGERRQERRERHLLEEELRRRRERGLVLEAHADDGLRRAQRAEQDAAAALDQLSMYEARDQDKDDQVWFNTQILGGGSGAARTPRPSSPPGRRPQPPRSGAAAARSFAVAPAGNNSPSRTRFRLPGDDYLSAIPAHLSGASFNKTPSSFQAPDRSMMSAPQQPQVSATNVAELSGYHPRLDELLENLM
mmetsp:Transcript_4798/g.8522  ORF Transcript_4798/g.8522 Transcript_4798/m.8522 type:complete len:381 (-) Transcript_4798:217-1359(-)